MSKLEAGHGADLDYRKRAGEIKDFKRQVVVPLIVNGVKVGTYVADYAVDHVDGTTEYIESKGKATPLWRLKWAIVEAMWKDRKDIKLTVQYK